MGKNGISKGVVDKDLHMLLAPDNIRVKFWSNVTKSASCWTYATKNSSYGQFYWKGVTMNCHRLAKLWDDNKNPGVLFCCHLCSTKKCVNPKHLYWGTPLDNVLNRFRDGTDNRGRQHPRAVIDERMAAHIWEEYRKKDITQHELAAQLNINVAIVSSVIKKQTWSHVTESLLPMPDQRRRFGMRRGETHTNAKLTIRRVAAIKRLLDAGCKQIDIVEASNLNKSQIQAIASEKTWAHLDHLDRRMLESLRNCSKPQF